MQGSTGVAEVIEPAAAMSEHGVRDAPAVELVRLRKHFGEVRAVDGVDLAIGDGEFFSMLGPSGSGKTTVLRLIAGFELPDGGAILLHGRDVARQPPYERDVNTVFQDYALFPHMTVQQNVEYGLKVKRVDRAERRRRAREMLETVRLAEYGARRPTQLSGGQRQRVALARALVNRPKVLLLDEPLGALDLKLREEMQVELKAIQHDVGITFVFVTHDQGEALSMSDRVAVFNNGSVEQVGTPQEIYERPASAFVARFVGTSNVISGATALQLLGRGASFVVRPERISVNSHDRRSGTVSSPATVRDVQYLGADVRVHAVLPDGTRLIAAVPASSINDVSAGREVTLAWPASAAFALAGAEPDSVTDNWGDEP